MATLIHDGFTLTGKVPARGQLWPEITFTYRPALPEAVYDYLRAQGGATGKVVMKLVANLLAAQLKSWSYETADGQPAPITPDTLRRVPQPALDEMLNHVCGYTVTEQEDGEKN